ncbi:MAG: hypothetical protein FWD17_17595 [Polyangiaceae bacterium]|nr:hypothetical protein [Polyangiaceae bacterium]
MSLPFVVALILKRRVQLFLFASWLAWSFVAIHVRGASDSIFGFSDHFSHFGHAELFRHHGFRIYQTPQSAFCGHTSPEVEAFRRESGCLAKDTCEVPGARPLCVNWQNFPVPYPPGLVLYSLPQALLYEAGVAFRTVNVLTIIEYLAAAHLLLWMFWRVVVARQGPATRGDLWLRFALFGVVYIEVIKWSLIGFYDPIALFALFAGIDCLVRKRPLGALVALSFGFLLHFRALWYTPLLVYAIGRAAMARDLWASPVRAGIKVAIALVGLLVFGYSLYLVYPSLRRWPQNNLVFWDNMAWSAPAPWSFLVPAVFLLIALAASGSWLLFATAVCQIWIVCHTPQIMRWHGMFLLPLIGVARLERGSTPIVAATALCAIEAEVVFAAFPSAGELVNSLIANWGPWWI